MLYEGKKRLLIWFVGVVMVGLALALAFYGGAAQAAPSEAPLLGITPTATMTTGPETPTATPESPTVTPTSSPPTATPTLPPPTVIPSPTTPPEPGVPGQVERVDPAIVKLVDPKEALPNEQVDFTIQVTNKGTVAAIGVVVTDEVSEYLEILDVETTQGTIQVTGQLVVVDVGVIGPDFVVDIVIRTRVRSDTPAPLEIENIAILTSHNGGEHRASGTLEIPAMQLPVTGQPAGSGGGMLAVVVALIAVIGLSIWESRKSPRSLP